MAESKCFDLFNGDWRVLRNLIILILALSNVSHVLALDTLKVGVIAPLTGPAQNMGSSLLRSLRLSQPENIDLQIQDDQCQPVRAISAYTFLRERGVTTFYVACSGSILALAPIAKRDRSLILTGYAGSAKIRETGAEVIRFNPDSISIAERMAADLADVSGPLLLISEEQDYAESLASVLKERLGEKIIVSERYRAGDASYRALITKHRRNIERGVIFIPVSDSSSILFYKELAEQRFKGPLYGDVNVCDQSPGPASYGIEGFCWKAYGLGAGFERFGREFAEQYGEAPVYQFYDAISQDIIFVLSGIIKVDATPDADQIRRRILSGVEGRLGSYRFTDGGEVLQGFEYLSKRIL